MIRAQIVPTDGGKYRAEIYNSPGTKTLGILIHSEEGDDPLKTLESTINCIEEELAELRISFGLNLPHE